MKNLMGFVMGALILAACQTTPKIDYVILSGSVSNTEAENVMVATNSERLTFELKDGAFSDTIKLESPQYMRMMVGREYTNIFLEPGKDVKVTVDMTNMDSTIAYSGAGAESNNYLAKKLLAGQNDPGFMDLYGKEEAEFIKTLDDMKTSRIGLLNESRLSNATFVNLEKKNIESERLSAKANYESYYQYVSKNSDFKASDSFMDDVKAFNKDDEAAFKAVPNFKSFVTNYFMSSSDPEAAYAELKSFKSAHIKEDIGQNRNPKIEYWTRKSRSHLCRH